MCGCVEWGDQSEEGIGDGSVECYVCRAEWGDQLEEGVGYPGVVGFMYGGPSDVIKWSRSQLDWSNRFYAWGGLARERDRESV